MTTEERTSVHEPSSAGRSAGGAAVSPILKTFADTTSQVVKQAASILEEEVAAGILAARQIENKFIDVNEIRAGKPDEVLQRFRRDAHEIVDILVDVVGTATRSAARMAERAVSIRTTDRSSPAATPVLTMPMPIKPGETAEVALVIENDGDTAAEPFTLRPTDLINAAGDHIAAHHVQFDFEQISLAAHQNKRVTVRVMPPADTRPGTYSGLIQSSRSDQLRAVLTVVVT
jgi:hypothetical protein